MDTNQTPAPDFRVCRGTLFVNDEVVPVTRRIVRIGLAAAGLDADDACGPISADAARRILHMERAFLLDNLKNELRRGLTGHAA